MNRLTKDEVYLNSIIFGINVNFLPFCGEVRTKETIDFIQKVFAKLKDYERRSELTCFWNGYTKSSYMGCNKDNEPKFADRTFYRCSGCRNGTVVKSNYCSQCGTKMEKPKKERSDK